MKKIIALGITGGILLSTSVLSTSAADMMMHSDTSMMMTTDTIMTSSMDSMKMDTMKMQATTSLSMRAQLRNGPTITLARYLGYTWKTDRIKLAQMINIPNYRGTVAQNIMIKKYLLSVLDASVMVGGAPMVSSRDIVDNAVRANNVTTVVAAVKAAGLVDTLKSAGPFTVFAPTNDAFAKLPAGTVETLIKPENKSTLVDILTYHVVAGKYTTADITDGMVLTTVEGKTLMFKKDSTGKIWINGSAMIETKDVISTNGVTHVIDTVLMPK
jgi:uncharacterized surface protein with fasciclin (FAS1) repeats